MAGSAAIPYSKQQLASGYVNLSAENKIPGKIMRFTHRNKLNTSQNETKEMIELFQQTKDHKHRLHKLTKMDQNELELSSVDLKIKLRQRPFQLPNKPARILAAPDILVDPVCTQVIDWAPFQKENSILAIAIGS